MARHQCSIGAISLLLATFAISATFCQTVTPAPPCDPQACNLPDCRCSSSEIPGGLQKAQTPQFVFLTFDDAVNEDNYAFYNDVFNNRKNPNNQPVTATFFVSHDYTIYPYIHDLYRKGHEIGLHSISGNASEQYWRSLDETGWRQELVEQRELINTFGRIPTQELTGVRAPQLQIGGDNMYAALKKGNIKWDSSRPTIAFRELGLWPYTNDYNSTQDCQIATCPIGQYTGFWTIPTLNYVGIDGSTCATADQCTPLPTTENETYDMLLTNFQTHYTGHKSPFGIFTRHGWLNGTGDGGDDQIWQRRLGYIRFLDYLDTLPDVYIVSISRALEWVKNPTPLDRVADFPAFQVVEKPNLCTRTYRCHYVDEQTPFKPPLSRERWFHSCQQCPPNYPWVGNILGRNPYN